jgi:hypothetical protein
MHFPVKMLLMLIDPMGGAEDEIQSSYRNRYNVSLSM